MTGFDGTCVRCGSELDHVATDGSPQPETDSTYRNYRCHGPCKADGGTVVVGPDGNVDRLVGPAVDASYPIRGDQL
jgi:hypothetical protein